MPPETDVKLNRTLTRRGKKNSIVRALALDRQVDSLADAHLAPLESHQVEVLIGVCGVPPARLVAYAVRPAQGQPRQGQPHPGGTIEFLGWKALAQHAQSGVIGFEAGVVQKLGRDPAEDGMTDVFEKRSVYGARNAK